MDICLECLRKTRVAKNGINVGEMQAKMLKTIEEMTFTDDSLGKAKQNDFHKQSKAYGKNW